MSRFSKDNAAQMGARGGRTTYNRHGREHMQRLGLRGFWTTVNRHWDGNARAYVNYLISMGLAATDAVPQNGAVIHDRLLMKYRAKYGLSGHLRRYWSPPDIPDGIDSPF